jgi:hypothetical protein
MKMSDKQSIRFYLFQLKDDIEHARDLLFMNSAYLRQQHLAVDGNNYKPVYQGDMNGDGQSTAEILESIYERFNLHHPDDFRGHSLSVSDIVVLREDGRDQAYFVDSYGFMEVPEFFAANPLEKVEELLEDDYGMIDGLINNGDRDREEKTEKTSLLEKLQSKKEEAEQMQKQTARESTDKMPVLKPDERTRE